MSVYKPQRVDHILYNVPHPLHYALSIAVLAFLTAQTDPDCILLAPVPRFPGAQTMWASPLGLTSRLEACVHKMAVRRCQGTFFCVLSCRYLVYGLGKCLLSIFWLSITLARYIHRRDAVD
jgi:hypothetical protein